MSDHTEIVKRSYDAFRENDIDRLLELYHPEAVWELTHWEDFLEETVYEGRAGIRRVLEMLQGDVGIIRNDVVEIVELGDGRVFVAGETTVRGASTGIEVDMPAFGQIIEFRDGQISRVDNYSDVAAARAAAGLPASP